MTFTLSSALLPALAPGGKIVNKRASGNSAIACATRHSINAETMQKRVGRESVG